MRYSLAVFLGGASYALVGVIVKASYGLGFDFHASVFSQALFGTIFLATCCVVYRMMGRMLVELDTRAKLQLGGIGLLSCTTSLSYALSLMTLPASFSIMLLFQFTWIGVILEVIATRKLPNIFSLMATAIVLIGTVFASGIMTTNQIEYDLFGVSMGLLSALSYSLFMFCSARVQTRLPAVQRGFFVGLGALCGACFVTPNYFAMAPLSHGFLPYAVGLGATGILIPVLLYAYGAPHLSTTVVTILASGELPVSVLLCYVVLGEPLTVYKVVGMVAILVGVLVGQLPSLRALYGQAHSS